MTARGLLFYPMFAVLAFWNLWALLAGLCCVSMGVIYGAARHVPERYAVRLAEVTYGAVLGGGVWLSL